MGRFKRRDRVVSDLAGAWCTDCHAYEGWTESHDKVRMWARRHVERTGHPVDVTITVVRRYLPKEE